MLKKVFGGAVFFYALFAPIAHAKPATLCSALLSSRVKEVMSEQRAEKEANFSRLLDKGFAKKLEDYYTRASLDEVVEKARETLSRLLADSDNLINPLLRKDYLYALNHYLERGGRFVIDLEMHDFGIQTDIIANRNPAYEFIRVPLYLLLYIEMDVPNTKENLLKDLTHELRHSITDQRTRRNLRRSGVSSEPDFIYAHIGPNDVNQKIAYAYMLEDEAIVAQNKFVPQASKNTGDINLYPELQSLQRLLHTFKYKDLVELESDITGNHHFSLLSSSYVDHYIQHLEKNIGREVMPPLVKALLPKILVEEMTFDRAVILALEDFDFHAKSIEGRLNDELYNALRSKMEALFNRKSLRLKRVYQSLARERS